MISVEALGLTWLDAECDRLAGRLVSTAPSVSGGFGATSAAVRALHHDVDDTARRIADRLRSTGVKLSSAADGFAVTEAVNEDLLHEV